MKWFDHVVCLLSILRVFDIMTERLELQLDACKFCQHAGLARSESHGLDYWVVEVHLIVTKGCKDKKSFM